MITEQQREQAARYALGDLGEAELQDFVAQVRQDPELRTFVRSLQSSLDHLALATSPSVEPPLDLKQRILDRLQSAAAGAPARAAGSSAAVLQGLRFIDSGQTVWKPLPIAGAFIKLLSLQADRGYAVLLGKLDPGVRYPAHTNVGPEDFYILTGDLHVGDRTLLAGDFHHADAGSQHTENYSLEGCTLLAVLTTDDPLVQLAMA